KQLRGRRFGGLMDVAALRRKWKAVGQENVLRFFDQLDERGRSKLAAQLEAQDPAHIQELAETYVKHKPPLALPKDIQPVKAFPREPDAANAPLYASAAKRGMQMLSEGKVAAFLVAGGQGTRLGYDGPKGEYPITPVKSKPLFQVFAEQLQ